MAPSDMHQWGLLLLGAVVAMGSEEQPVCSGDDSSCRIDEIECGVYMAPSTIGDDSNLGIYTGIPLKEGQTVNYPEIAIPIVFRDWGFHGDNPDGTLWDRYIWDSPVAGIEPKYNDLERSDNGAVFVPGVGCTVNSRLDMNTVISTSGSIYDTVGVHRSKHPEAGSFAPYHSSKTVAKMDLEPGRELFAAYGDTWIPEIPRVILTTNDNMDETDEFLAEYAAFVEKCGDRMSTEAKEALWNLTSKELARDFSFILNSLPRASWSEVEKELKAKTDDSISRHFVVKSGYRDPEWLKREGKCQDHLKPDNSTIPQAGRGAFAARNLPKGTVVGYAPLIHMGDNRDLWMLEYQRKDRSMYQLEDLVINYSFMHRESSLILTPYGAMVNYINHSREKANVKVQWPTRTMVAHKPDWLNKDVSFLKNTHEKIGLSFDYVALRDLEEGEEIFMDYGDEWIAAWEKHVLEWKPLPNADVYFHSTEWEQVTGETFYRTKTEQMENPYPETIIFLCQPSYKGDGKGGYMYTPPRKATSMKHVYCDIVVREEPVSRTESDTSSVKNSTKQANYIVNLFWEENTQEDPVVVTNYPHDSILMTDRVRSADWHMENAFRHPIMIPDDVFPETWKNVVEKPAFDL